MTLEAQVVANFVFLVNSLQYSIFEINKNKK